MFPSLTCRLCLRCFLRPFSAAAKVYGETYRQLSATAVTPKKQGITASPVTSELSAAADAAAATADAATAEAERLSQQLRADTARFGEEFEWKGWPGQCVVLKTGVFTYELCPFGKATQTTPDGVILLGAFAEPAPASPNGDAAKEGLVWAFVGGDECPNGVKRGVTVRAECSDAAALLEVTEPKACVYTMRIGAPAACTAAEAARVGITEADLRESRSHDEL